MVTAAERLKGSGSGKVWTAWEGRISSSASEASESVSGSVVENDAPLEWGWRPGIEERSIKEVSKVVVRDG